MSFDFSNARLPRLLPLENSYAENEVEADLKRLFIDLFASTLAADAFDVNVLGAAHLGSFDLVRRAVNTDGLVLLQGDGEEAATRYLYRAWKASNAQGRGLHFLRTYLQLLFPNIGEVSQLWQGKAQPYPLDLRDSESPDAFLTSRVRITINSFPNQAADSLVMNCLPSVMPARFVPSLRHVATSSIGKIRDVMVGCVTQNLNSAGTLRADPRLEGQSVFAMAGPVHGAQLLRSHGGAA